MYICTLLIHDTADEWNQLKFVAEVTAIVDFKCPYHLYDSYGPSHGLSDDVVRTKPQTSDTDKEKRERKLNHIWGCRRCPYSMISLARAIARTIGCIVSSTSYLVNSYIPDIFDNQLLPLLLTTKILLCSPHSLWRSVIATLHLQR